MNRMKLIFTSSVRRRFFLFLMVLLFTPLISGWIPIPSLPDSGGALSGKAVKGADLWGKLEDLNEKSTPLDPNRGADKPDYDPPGMPEIPLACPKDKACRVCYESANKRIGKLRKSFEHLRLLYKETDDFVKAAVAFGDGIAGSAGVGALEWNAQRRKIKGSQKSFEAAYRKKYAQLLGDLKEALQQIAKCEKQYFGEDDWYARYGFIFQTFMSLHYQR